MTTTKIISLVRVTKIPHNSLEAPTFSTLSLSDLIVTTTGCCSSIKITSCMSGGTSITKKFTSMRLRIVRKIAGRTDSLSRSSTLVEGR